MPDRLNVQPSPQPTAQTTLLETVSGNAQTTVPGNAQTTVPGNAQATLLEHAQTSVLENLRPTVPQAVMPSAPSTSSQPTPGPGTASSAGGHGAAAERSASAGAGAPDQGAGRPELPCDRHGDGVDPEAARSLLEPAPPLERVRWAYDTFGEAFALTTSFGIQSAVMLHLISQVSRSIPVIWVDTGYLHPETYRYAAELTERFGLNLQVAQAELSPARMEALYGRLWETGSVEDLTTYHRLRKVEPLEAAMERLSVGCWASGVRGGQTDHRRSMALLDGVRRRWSLRPLLSWTQRDVYYYMEEHQLPQHPLFALGYSTVGDLHSSAPDDGQTSGRATRFGGLKQECGIHLSGEMGEGI